MMISDREQTSDVWYRALVLVIPLFVTTYVLVAALPPLLHIGGPEKYLLYHWLVFTEVPSHEETTYEADVISVLGKPIPPIRIESSGVLLIDELRKAPEYNRRIQVIGKLLASGSVDEAFRQRKEFETFMTKRNITYEIVEVRYDPIIRFRTGEVTSRRVIGTYEATSL